MNECKRCPNCGKLANWIGGLCGKYHIYECLHCCNEFKITIVRD
jgi:hypothetical protein